MKKQNKFFSIKNWSLKTKLYVTFLLILLVPSIVIGISSYQKAQTVLGDYIIDTALNGIVQVNEEVNETFETKSTDLNHLTDEIDREMYADKQQLNKMLHQYIQFHPEVMNIYIGADTGETMIEPSHSLPDDFDPREQLWYEEAMADQEEVIITEPYLDKATDEMVITVAQVMNDGSGVMGMDINLTNLAEITNEVHIGEEGYAFILDQDNTYLVHPHEEHGTQPEGDWTEKLFDQDNGKFTYSLDGDAKEMVFATNELTGWKIAGTMYTSELKDAAQGIMLITTIVIVVAVIIGLFVVIMITRSITKPLNSLTSSVKKISEGDLTDSLTVESEDEIGQLTSGVQDMQNNLRNIIQHVSQTSENLTGQSEELSQSANEVKTGTQQIATTMQELASGSEAQANNASDISEVMDSFAGQMQEANENGEQIYASSTEMLDITREGKQVMEASLEQMSSITELVQSSVERVKVLDHHSREITKIVYVIKDIAEQTNLLALNAAIEAARAGEHGQGFAVVADEVRKLAEQVGESIGDITTIVDNIQSETTDVVTSLESGYQAVEEGNEQAAETMTSFTTINQSVEQMTENIKLVIERLATMSSNSQEMNASIEEIASISEESAAGVEQTAASAQQASSSVEEVANSSNRLAKLSEELNSLIRQFKL
ncbi:methyl-accepting chemotaxis protein [Gracilibacillus sp. S3-1-1]|uniref:Methyl-accepting chemotaxis protein n=1 Tax=Gracilibacillus pellucidus TaxID=3095368 RepID=A0ACC6M105_9BACI|nr:methyl-accepting chemotaxis protein [Gracilibacillus sp. S3-1-1]MDX8044625.1 methyl-accepting chemotaxis protein [Gracilibacillus sp. S3-1-1]